MTKFKIGAKVWSIALVFISWLVTQPDVLRAANNFSTRHHWALAFGALLTLLGHMFYQPTKGV